MGGKQDVDPWAIRRGDASHYRRAMWRLARTRTRVFVHDHVAGEALWTLLWAAAEAFRQFADDGRVRWAECISVLVVALAAFGALVLWRLLYERYRAPIAVVRALTDKRRASASAEAAAEAALAEDRQQRTDSQTWLQERKRVLLASAKLRGSDILGQMPAEKEGVRALKEWTRLMLIPWDFTTGKVAGEACGPAGKALVDTPMPAPEDLNHKTLRLHVVTVQGKLDRLLEQLGPSGDFYHDQIMQALTKIRGTL